MGRHASAISIACHLDAGYETAEIDIACLLTLLDECCSLPTGIFVLSIRSSFVTTLLYLILDMQVSEDVLKINGGPGVE